MDYLKRGAHTTFDSIRKHKGLFALIVVLQIIFVVSIGAWGIPYLIKTVEDIQGFIGPLEKANYDSAQIQQGEPFTPNYAPLVNSAKSMLRNFIFFVVGILTLYLIFNGVLWFFSHKILKNGTDRLNWKEMISFFLKIWVAFFLLFIPFVIGSYFALIYFLRLTQSVSDLQLAIKVLLGVKIIFYYVLLAAWGSAFSVSWKKFGKRVFLLSILRSPKTFLLFVVNMIMILASFSLIYITTQYADNVASLLLVILLLLLGLLCMVMLAVTRIFWIASIQEIESDRK